MEPAHHLDASSTALVTDSSCDVPPGLRPPNWRVVPIPVSFGAESFADGVDIDAAGFYARLARSERLPTTSQPPTAELAEVLREALETHETAVVLPLSGKMSGTVEGFRAAAREVGEERVLVLESKSVTFALGLLAMRLQARLERGCTAAQAEADMAALSDDHRVVFSLERLEYLQRGARGPGPGRGRLAAARAADPPVRRRRGGALLARARRPPGHAGHARVPGGALGRRPAAARGARSHPAARGDPRAWRRWCGRRGRGPRSTW